MFPYTKPCLCALLALIALFSQPTRASWVYEPPEHHVSAARVVVTGTIAHVSWNKTKRGGRDGKKYKYRYRIARLKVEEVLKNELVGITVEAGALLEFPIVRNRWGKSKGFEHMGFSCQKGDSGIWLLNYSGDTFRAYPPGAHMAHTEIGKVRGILRDLGTRYQEALKEEIPAEERRREEILTIPVYPRSKIESWVHDGKGLVPGVAPSTVYVLGLPQKPMETLFLDARGKVVGGVPYHARASAFSQGWLRVSTRLEENLLGGYRFMARDGKLVAELPHGGEPSGASRENAGQYPDSNGQDYVAQGPFKGGLAKVWIRGRDPKKEGFIDREGDLIFPPMVATFGDFSEGLVAFREHQKTDKWGYLDTKGKVVIRPQFIRAQSFSGDRAAVEYSSWIKRPPVFSKDGAVHLSPEAPKHFLGTRRGFIDRAGNLINPIGFDYADGFRNGLARVNYSSRIRGGEESSGLMDRDGKIVFVISNSFLGSEGGKGN